MKLTDTALTEKKLEKVKLHYFTYGVVTKDDQAWMPDIFNLAREALEWRKKYPGDGE